MKYSRFNFLLGNGPRSILYNAVSDGIILLHSDLVPTIMELKEDMERLAEVHADLYASMLQRGMIVEEHLDETECLISFWKKEDTDPAHFYLTILPTLDCNLRCWYCYEEHRAKSDLSEATREKIIRFVDKLTGDSQLKYLHLSFFGGEPLLHFEETVWPLLQSISRICEQREVILLLHFTTNGVLLTPETIKRLLSLNLANRPNVQITLDGNRRQHDQSRHTSDRQPTFDVIVHHIHEALRAGFTVTNRLNYTQESVDSFIDVLNEYADLTEEEKERLSFDFQQVWQEGHLKEARARALGLAERYKKDAFQIHIDKQYNKSRCRSDADNQVVINYDGKLYSCTGRDMTEPECEGYLADDGVLVFNDRHHYRMLVKYGNEFCRKCKIFPICHGLCSQSKMESDVKNGCLRGLNDEQRIEIIKGRLDYLLKNKVQTNSILE